jgi:pSer/pThr/pTyr-binding forkhead associated (FHA) protein
VAYLQIRFASGESLRYPLIGEETSIGRSPKASLCLPDLSLSRFHSSIVRQGGSFVLQDQGSRNGTYVNDLPLKAKKLLEDGDEIRIGTAVAVFRASDELREILAEASFDQSQALMDAIAPEEEAGRIGAAMPAEAFPPGLAANLIETSAASPDTSPTYAYDPLSLAREIQSYLLPRESPTLSGYELVGDMQPCFDVGGDFYDYVQRPDGAFAIIVGDVARKGVGAALLGHYTQALFRTVLDYELWLDRVLGKVNRDLCLHCAPHQFVTACLCVLQPSSGELHFANAGHCRPLLFGADGSAQSLQASSMMLGILSDTRYTVGRAILEPGGLLALYSDGAVECQDSLGREFGVERLEAVLREHRAGSPRAMVNGFKKELARFTSGTTPEDDITMIVLQRARSS